MREAGSSALGGVGVSAAAGVAGGGAVGSAGGATFVDEPHATRHSSRHVRMPRTLPRLGRVFRLVVRVVVGLIRWRQAVFARADWDALSCEVVAFGARCKHDHEVLAE